MPPSCASAISISALALAKRELRRALLAARHDLHLNPALAARLNAQLAQQLAQFLAESAAACVGFYWPLADEFDARATLAAWLAEATALRRAALPVVSAPQGVLAFHAWHPGAEMQNGRYNIPVPASECAVQPDLLLVPCVGFDAARLRLGYGGGYYDRTLAALQPRPYAVGIAYEAGRVAALPCEPHDVPLNAIVTEAGWF